MKITLKIKENFYCVPAILMLLESCMVFLYADPFLANKYKMGLQGKVVLLGIMELGFAIVLLFPGTRLIGFFCCAAIGVARLLSNLQLAQ